MRLNVKTHQTKIIDLDSSDEAVKKEKARPRNRRKSFDVGLAKIIQDSAESSRTNVQLKTTDRDNLNMLEVVNRGSSESPSNHDENVFGGSAGENHKENDLG